MNQASGNRPSGPHPARRAALSTLAVIAALLLLAWCAGLVWFAAGAQRPAKPVPRADGIVVLTGGAGRIEAAIDLLSADRARLMLISGVAEQLGLEPVAHAAGRTLPPMLADRISLGHAATSTIGNAIETASWARANNLHSLIVVTAGYHMRRALAEIGTALPDVTLYPDPVRPPALRGRGLGTLRLLAMEYTKWLAVEFGLTGSAHLSEIS